MEVGDIVRVCFPEELMTSAAQRSFTRPYQGRQGCILTKVFSLSKSFSVIKLDDGKEKAFWDDYLVTVHCPMTGADEYEDILAGQALMEGS